MLQLPVASTTAVPSTVLFGAKRVMVSPGAPVPLMAGLGLLVTESVAELPVSFAAFCVSVAVGTSSTGVMLMVTVSVSVSDVPVPVRPGSAPVLPPSLVTMVRVTAPLALLAGAYMGELASVLR